MNDEHFPHDVMNRQLYHFTKESNVLAVQHLLHNGADPNFRFSGVAVVVEAARQGNDTIVRHLLDAGADDKANNARALQEAAQHGHAAVVNTLMAIVDCHTDRQTALQYAVLNIHGNKGHNDVVDLLFDPDAAMHILATMVAPPFVSCQGVVYLAQKLKAFADKKILEQHTNEDNTIPSVGANVRKI